MTHYQKWTVIVNGEDFCLFIDDKEAAKIITDPSTPKLSSQITDIEEVKHKDGLIQISLGDTRCVLKGKKFTKTTLFSCVVESPEDLLQFWKIHSDYLLDVQKSCVRDGSVDHFESCNSAKEKNDSSIIKLSQNSSTSKSSCKQLQTSNFNESDSEDDSEKLTRSYLFNVIGKKKVTYKMMDIFTLLDPPHQYKVRDTNKEFVNHLATKMIEKNSVSVDNAPAVIGMIDIDIKDYKEEDFQKYKIFVIDGNHSVQAQKVAYKKTKSVLFKYRGVNIYCGLTANEAVLLGISRNEDTEDFCKFSDFQKVEMVRRRLYDITNTPETEDPPKQPKNFKDIFACLLNLQGKKAMDGKNTLRFLATSLSNRCFQLYTDICHKHSRNVPASKFECLRGLQEKDIFMVLFNLSLTDLDRDSWQQFAVECQEKHKKPKRHRKDVTVTFQFNEVSTQGFIDQKPMHGNCINYRFVDGEDEAILSCKELKELVFSTENGPKFLEVSKKDLRSASKDIIVPESPSSDRVEEEDKNTEITFNKEVSHISLGDFNRTRDIKNKPTNGEKRLLLKRKIQEIPFHEDIIVPESPSSDRVEEEDKNTEITLNEEVSKFTSSSNISLGGKPGCSSSTPVLAVDNNTAEEYMLKATSVSSKPGCSSSTPVDNNTAEEYMLKATSVSRFLYNMADDDAAKRAELGMYLIEEDEVETKPEVLDDKDVLLDREIQDKAKIHFTEDAWMLVKNTLKMLEEKYILDFKRKGNLGISAKSKSSFKLKKGNRSVYSFSGEESLSPVKITPCKRPISARAIEDQVQTESLIETKEKEKTKNEELNTSENISLVKTRPCKIRLTDITSVKNLKNYTLKQTINKR